ncbi:MAG: hypothetical protein DWQ05_14105 [Calditrichaeota bacterium]|nr:MAG: hypothetical protein DWQ05_14105 [Calditrichota bacterium]
MDQLKKMRDYRESQHQLPNPNRNGIAGRPVFWGIFSGKGGVGKSIICGSLALELARLGYRTLFVDTDFSLPNAQLLFDLDDFIDPDTFLKQNDGKTGVLSAGIKNLDIFTMQPQAEPANAKVIRCLDSLFQNTASEYDFLLFDAANGFGDVHRRLCRALDLMTITSTADPASITNAYALIKMVKMLQPGLPMNAVINRVSSQEKAAEAFGKLNKITAHFLQFEVPLLCWLREDKQVAAHIHEGLHLDKWPQNLSLLHLVANAVEKLAPQLKSMDPKIENEPEVYA